MSVKQTKLTDFFLLRKRPATDKLCPDIHEERAKRLKCHEEDAKPQEDAKVFTGVVDASVEVAVEYGHDVEEATNIAANDSKPEKCEMTNDTAGKLVEGDNSVSSNAPGVEQSNDAKLVSTASDEEARANLGGEPMADKYKDNVAFNEGATSGENNAFLGDAVSFGDNETTPSILAAAERTEETPKRVIPKTLSTMEKLSSSTPKLTDHDIVISIPDSPRKYLCSPLAAASPRKNVAASLTRDRANLWQHAHTLDLPMPMRYRFLGEAFRAVDHICSLKHNRSERILVTEVKRSVGRAISRVVTDAHLGQLRTVFPQAYFFAWEQIPVGNRTKRELIMTPNLNFRADWLAGRSAPEPAADNSQKSMSPEALVERRRIFNNVLLSIVMDQHNLHLKQIDPLMSVDESKLTRWDSDFTPDKDCADIEVSPLPEAPGSVTKAKVVRNLFGEVPGDETISTIVVKSEAKAEICAEETERPQVFKELEKLPQNIVEKIMDKERERRVNTMTETPTEKKHRLMLEELQSMGPMIANCYRSERKRLKSGAVSTAGFFRFVSDSCGNKSQSEVEPLVRHLALVAPDFFEIFELGGPEYFKQKPAGELSNAALRQHLAGLLTETNRKRL